MTSLFCRPYFCLAASMHAPLLGAAAHVWCDESSSPSRKSIARASLVMDLLPQVEFERLQTSQSTRGDRTIQTGVPNKLGLWPDTESALHKYHDRLIRR